jgi:hypothetical protein
LDAYCLFNWKVTEHNFAKLYYWTIYGFPIFNGKRSVYHQLHWFNFWWRMVDISWNLLTETLSTFIAFSWNVLLPIALIFLSIMQYRLSHTDELFHNHKRNGTNIYGSHNYLSNWSVRAKQFGKLLEAKGFFQLAFPVLIPCVSIVQIYRYLSNGPPDFLDVS